MKELVKYYLSDLNSWLIFLILIGVAVIVGVVLTWVIFRLLKWNGKRYKPKSLYNSSVRNLERPVAHFTIIFLIIQAAKATPLNVEEASVLPLTADMMASIRVLLRIILYIVSAWTLMRVANIFIEIVEAKNEIDTANNLQQRKIATQLQFIRKIAAVIIVVIAVSMSLLEFEEVRKIGTGLLTSAGVAGIIIGFAAQKSIANLLAGLQIAFTQPIRIDDVVIVEGEFGRVEEITLTYVVVRVWDQRRVIVPLNYFIEKPFQNWTRFNAELLGTVFIYADYRLPIAPLRQELERLTEGHPLWDGRVRNVLVTDLSPETMTIRILVSAQSSSDAFDLRCEIREKMVTFIQENYPESLPMTRIEMKSATRNLATSQGLQ
ncbi:MAG: mechanosensitive ion channel domain-containing protein [Bacteroidota bacterium]